MAEFDKTIRKNIAVHENENVKVTVLLRYLTRSIDYKIGQEQVIQSNQVLIGRDVNCDVRYNDSYNTVSRRHASITKENGDWVLTNISESNPTLINSRPIKKSWYLSSGDVIQFSIEGPKIEFIVRTVIKEVKQSEAQSRIEKKLVSKQSKDELETVYQIVSFCFPFIGAIIWLVNMKSSPKKAKTACYAALLGIGISFLINVVAGAS
tara:strand:+ start:380 stop:1003 length:624 start_codon:yes stop_codon:yes gene_type:complete